MTDPTGQLRLELLALIEAVPSITKALDYLELYEAVGSQRRVADLRNASASSVSELLTRLEKGLKLTDGHGRRDLRSLIANGEADAFIDAVHNVLEASEQLVLAAAKLREQRTVLLTTFNPHVKSFVAAAVQAFHREQSTHRILLPRAMGGFRRVSFDEIRKQLLAGQSDYLIANVDSSEPHSDDELQWERLYDYRLVVAAEDGHPWMSSDAVSGDDLVQGAGRGLLLGPEGFLSRDATHAIFRARDRQPDILMENPDTNTRVSLAVAGYGVAIAHEDGIDPAFRRRFPPLSDERVATSGAVIVAWSSKRQIDVAAHQTLLRCLSEAAANRS